METFFISLDNVVSKISFSKSLILIGSKRLEKEEIFIKGIDITKREG
jgi:hypothetical protein